MKKIILAFTATAILTLMAHSNANAQHTTGSKVLINLALLSTLDSASNPVNSGLSNGASLSSVNVHAVKGFQKAFKGANASWFKADDGGYIARFYEGTVKNIVAYDAKGTWNHNIRYYSEKEMPRDVRATVKSTYYDYSILGVSEVHYEDQIIYIILLQDETSIKTLRVCDGEMEEVSNLKRG